MSAEYGCKQAYAAKKGDRQPEHDPIDRRATARDLVPPTCDPFLLAALLGDLGDLRGLGGRVLDATPGRFDFGFGGTVIARP